MKILLFGAQGQIGWELQRALAPLGECIAPARRAVDLGDADSLRACVRTHAPDLIVNAAAWTEVDAAERQREQVFQINAHAPQVLAQEASRLGAWLVHYSTDYVFDGAKTEPYNEEDAANPLSVYGASKLAGEERVREACARHLILRTGWVYSLRRSNFPKTILRLASERARLQVVDDQFGTPTHAELVADLTALALHHLRDTAQADTLAGTYHLAASGKTSWHLFARRIVEQAHANGVPLVGPPDGVEPISTSEYNAPASRPRNACLDTTRFCRTFNVRMPDWRMQVDRMLAEVAEVAEVAIRSERTRALRERT